ncbi:MAG: transposase [Methanophagales archaeon]|nr:transposase [Methanophagales archaeon]
MVYAGLDLHKSFCQVLVCEKEGELIKEGRIKTEAKDIAEFFSGLEDLTIAFEASSNYEYFYDLLEGLGHKVILAHPLKTKMIAEAKIKTDKIDAKTLAELLRVDFLPTSYVPPKEIRELRHLVRHRIFLGKYRGIIKNQIKTELRRKNIKYPDGAGIFVGRGKKWLCDLKNPVIDSYLAIYEAVDRELKNAEREIEKAFSYAGLVPRVHQSGNTSYYGRITMNGISGSRPSPKFLLRFAPQKLWIYQNHCMQSASGFFRKL